MNPLYNEITHCRICSSISPKSDKGRLQSILDFGDMSLTGVFLKNGKDVPTAPMELCRCVDCGLTQLRHTYNLDALYGEWYGYESHLNPSMVQHLQSKASVLESLWGGATASPVYVDIAANDGTLLSGYEAGAGILIGIDPLINVVKDCYPSGSIKIADFFSAEKYWQIMDRPARIVTSLSVLYDLDSPITFAREVSSILEDGGIWHFEQSYLPSMVATNSYDTICHEHLLYLTMHDILKIVDTAGLQIIDATLNDVNGGSIAVTAIKTSETVSRPPFVEYLLNKEIIDGYMSGTKLSEFATEVHSHIRDLNNLIHDLIGQGKTIMGLGASTKGNVILQCLKLDSDKIKSIGDVNIRKFGLQTPGTGIPIVDEKEIDELADSNTILIVLPWHFRSGMIRKSKQALSKGTKLLFPLPRIEIYG